MTYRWLFLLLLPTLPGRTEAQTDFRNLDDDRPVPTEDAYPVERRALELVLPWHFEHQTGTTLNALVPELAWGAVANFHLGVKAPLAVLDDAGTRTGLAGVRGFALYNFWTESSAWPALALRGDLALPLGEFGGEELRGTLELIGTRSFGRWRLHLNGTYGFRDPAEPALVEPLPRWSLGGALDRTLFRQSLLLIGDVTASALTRTAATEVRASAGLRWQWSPTLVLDLGVSRRLTEGGPDLGLTLGVSRVFGLAGGSPPAPRSGGSPLGGAAASPPVVEQRDETFYVAGRFNWQFLANYPEAARLFNAFDYGHAVLYERLYDDPLAPVEELEQHEFDFLTSDLLVRPPRLAVSEESIAPDYSRFAWRASAMFHWAHVLHRQLYDIYADPRLADSTRMALAERVTDDYLADRALAFTTAPKAMALMDDQPYSQVFRRRYPRFNGLIWAYHWLQVGLYEPLILGQSSMERKAGVQATVARFWEMLAAAPGTTPQLMPMTAAIAPEFSRRHPRAAVIFDNLHMLHDIISDVLLSEELSRAAKRAEIYKALARFQDPTADVMTMQEWAEMADRMGGVELMGGKALGPRARGPDPVPAPHQH